MTTREIVIVLTTAPDGERAESWARLLVDERLAACVNVHAPMVSLYRWKGVVERDDERQMVIKTTGDRVPALQTRMRELHPYELPEFLVLPTVGGSPAYLEWVAEATSATFPTGGA
jgi:periplasmic divalent cation tolerance protein